MVFRGPAPVIAPLRSAADDVVRLAAGAVVPSELASGEAVLAMPLPLPFELPALRKGDGVRPTTGGVAVRETGGVGRLIDGLSHEEKKSSSGSPAGVDDPSVGVLLVPSVATTSLGYLTHISGGLPVPCNFPYKAASLAARLFNSVLYLSATLFWYLVFGSSLFNAAVPPFD